MVDSELYESITLKLYVFIVVVMVVTEANKRSTSVSLIVAHRIAECIAEQFRAVVEGPGESGTCCR